MFSNIPRILAEEMAHMVRMTDELTRFPSMMNRYMIQPLMSYRESEVHNTDKEFRIRMDMQHFKPEEIKVTSDNQRITVLAKHNEKEDEQGFVARELTRTYKMPEGVDPKSVTSSLSDQGVLHIKVQKLALDPPKETPISVEFK